jgi:Skp family chaperone for outer membrane proteins
MPMSTTPVVATLFQLQQLDLELERLIAEQQALMQALQADATVKKARMENLVAQQQLQAGLQAQQEAEWALEDLNRRSAGSTAPARSTESPGRDDPRNDGRR